MGRRGSVGRSVGRLVAVVPALFLALVLALFLATGMAAGMAAETTEPEPESDTSTIRQPVSYGKPNQSRIWYNTALDRWDALIPRNDEANNQDGGLSASDHYLVTDLAGRRTVTEVELEDRDFARPDVFWDDRSGLLHVLSSHPTRAEFWRLRHDRAADRYRFEVGASGSGVVVPGMGHPPTGLGGDSPATVHVSPNGDVWVAVMTSAGLLVQHSSDGGATWLGRPIVLGEEARLGVTTWITFETGGRTVVGLFAGENGVPSVDTDFLFWHIDQGTDPTDVGNWIDDTPNIPQSVGSEQADDHVSAARDRAGNLYFAVKTESGGPTDPLVKLYRRTPAGAWSQFEVTRTEEVPEQSRPSIVIDDEREEISIYVSGAEVVGQVERQAGRFTAPLGSLTQLADAPFVPLFSRPGTVFTDVITPRHPVTADSGVVVLAHNRSDREVWSSSDGAEPDIFSVTLVADQDSWLRQRNADRNYGTDRELEVRTERRADERAVVRFDIGPLPANARILSATARFHVTNPDPDAVRVYRVTDRWTETGATWRNTGRDVDRRTIQSMFTPRKGDTEVSVDLTSLVQQWVCGTPNNGVMLIARWDAGQSKFASREAVDPDLRPALDIEYASAPSTCPG